MKRFKISLVAVMALSGLVAFGPMAQAQDKNDTKPPVKPAAAPEVKPLPQPAARPDRVQRFGELLKLSDEQKDKIRPLLDDEAKQMNEIRQDAKITREDRMAKYRQTREATDAKVKPILNTEQQEKWAQMRGPRPRPTAPAAQPPAQKPPPPADKAQPGAPK